MIPELTPHQLDSICLSYDHSFGLMDDSNKNRLRFQAKEWHRAIHRELYPDAVITEQQILEKYPVLFKQKDLPMTETTMCWGLEVPHHWLPIIDNLCYVLTNYGYSGGCKYGKYNQPTVVAEQVKQKYGELRFYYHLEFDEETMNTDKKAKGQVTNGYYKYYDGVIDFAEYCIEKLEK